MGDEVKGLEPREILEEKEFESRLYDLIIRYEKVEPQLYVDDDGIPTIASGYNLEQNNLKNYCNKTDINIT